MIEAVGEGPVALDSCIFLYFLTNDRRLSDIGTLRVLQLADCL